MLDTTTRCGILHPSMDEIDESSVKSCKMENPADNNAIDSKDLPVVPVHALPLMTSLKTLISNVVDRPLSTDSRNLESIIRNMNQVKEGLNNLEQHIHEEGLNQEIEVTRLNGQLAMCKAKTHFVSTKSKNQKNEFCLLKAEWDELQSGAIATSIAK